MFIQIFEVITVGLPFCLFKVLSGLYLAQYWLIGLGLIDTLINLANLFSLLVTKNRMMDACLFSFIVRLFKKPLDETKWRWQQFGNSLDVLLSFSIVALMIGGGYLAKLSPSHLNTWNIAVILNVLGAGMSQVTNSIRNLKN